MDRCSGVPMWGLRAWASSLLVCVAVVCQAADPPKALPREITNSISMKLVLIPAGEFMMGSQESPEKLAKAYGDEENLPPSFFKQEYPLHRVRITKPFYLGMHEVTVGQFRQFVKDTGYITDAEKERGKGAYGWTPWASEFQSNSKYSWQTAGFEQTDKHPVINVSWNDAIEFCKWLSGKEDATYRLPTEAEWEYACRAGTTTLHHNGDDVEKLATVANVADATARANLPWSDWKTTIKVSDGYVFTAPVGQLKPNRFGLFDMHGNVCEWCADWYAEDYYKSSPPDDPQGPDSGGLRVLRGGSWNYLPVHARSAYRFIDIPEFRRDIYGFRVARTSEDNRLAAREADNRLVPPLRMASQLLRNGRVELAVERLKEIASKNADSPLCQGTREALGLLEEGKVEDAKRQLQQLIDQHSQTPRGMSVEPELEARAAAVQNDQPSKPIIRQARDGEDANIQAEAEEDYQFGVTSVFINQVRTNDPRGELEAKTRYLNDAELALIRHADGRELESTNYFVFKFIRPAQYTISVTCRAGGNRQILFHSPRSTSLPSKSFTEVKEPRTLVLSFDAADSPYLLMNCGIPGSVYVDAVSIQKIGSRSTDTKSGQGRETEGRAIVDQHPEPPGASAGQRDSASRTWTDTTGEYRVEAEFAAFQDGVVRLRKEDGQEIEVSLEKLSLADQRYVRTQTQVAGRPKRDGLLVETAEGLYYVDLNGNMEPFAEGKKVVGRPAVRGRRVFVLVDGAIKEYTARGKQVRATAISDLGRPLGMVAGVDDLGRPLGMGRGALDESFQKREKSASRLLALPERGFALLSPSRDWVYFLDDHGVWQRTVKILKDLNWPNLLGTVAGEGLLVSDDDMRDVRRVDLKTFKTELFMRSDRSLGPIAFDPDREIYYVCSGGAIHAVSLKGNPRQPNVSQTPKVTTVVAPPKNKISGSTVRPNFINGIAVDEQFAYLTLIPYHCIVRVNIATGDSEVFVEELHQPDVILRLRESM